MSAVEGNKYKHYKNGKVYEVMYLTNTDGDDERKKKDHPVDVVYKDEDDKIWSRPLSDWDRSFTLVEEDGSENMLTRKTWEEFRETGLVLIINQVLHIFGWAICFELKEGSEEVDKIYPSRVKFRGFSNESTEKAYRKVSNYLSKISTTLKNEASK